MSTMHTIRNQFLSLTVSSHGGEMQSLCYKDVEYLWQGQSDAWRDRAPVLFPYIARLTNGSYTYQGKSYQMNIHGFLKDSELNLAAKTDDCLCFELESSDETRKQYPFDFLVRLTFKLVENALVTKIEVENKTDGPMYFGIGGHPGFNIPLGEKGDFTDYYLEFSNACTPSRTVFSPDNFVTGSQPYPLEGENVIKLDHQKFVHDAIILESTSGSVTLKNTVDNRFVQVDYPDYPYIGFWTRPNANAPYLCIEPWSSLPSRKDIVEDLATQPSLLQLDKGKSLSKEWVTRLG